MELSIPGCEQCSCPTVVTTRWNFQSWVVNSVHGNKSDLVECFENIENEDGWDDITVREAFDFKKFA
jgi:hypothetical protein